jgi:hypothetical protein
MGCKQPQSPGDDRFVAVSSIGSVPRGVAGKFVNLNEAEVNPANATDKTILWELIDAGETGVTEIRKGVFTPVSAGTLKARAVIARGKSETEPYTQDFAIYIDANGNFVSVTAIRGIPGLRRTGTGIDLNDIAAVFPANATNKTIEWELMDGGTTGAEGIEGGIVTPQSDGYLTIRASVLNGTAQGTPFTVDFTIECLSHDPFPGFSMFIVEADESRTRLFADSQPGLENVDSLQKALIWLDANAAKDTHYLIELETSQKLHRTTLTSNADVGMITISIVGKDAEQTISYDGSAVVYGPATSTALLTITGSAASKSVTLKIGNHVTFDGLDTPFSGFNKMLEVGSYGKLVMEEGAKITRFRAANANTGLPIGTSATPHEGAVVAVTGSGSFTMEGGKISGNTFSRGAVHLSASSTFTMRGGEIRENTTEYAGGFICAVNITKGTMEMYNPAKITQNHRMSGVRVFNEDTSGNSSTFNMYGGEISCNADTTEAEYTATGFVRTGVLVESTGSNAASAFSMAGGKIAFNGREGPGSAIMTTKSSLGSVVVTLKGSVEIQGNLGFYTYMSAAPVFNIEPAFENTAGTTKIALAQASYSYSMYNWRNRQLLTPSNGLFTIDTTKFSLVPKLYNYVTETDITSLGEHFYKLGTDGKLSLFVPVTGIYSGPVTTLYINKGTTTTLSTYVQPTQANNRDVTWNLKDSGTVGTENVTLNGANITATAIGTLTLTATITNGLGEGQDYTHDFTVQVLNPVTAVASDLMSSGTGTATATGTVGTEIDLNAGFSTTPVDAWWLEHPNVVWEVNDTATGNLLGLANNAKIPEGKFTPTTAGSYSVRVRCYGNKSSTITATPSDFTRVLTITVSAAQ